MAEYEEVDAYPTWHWECPKCDETDEDGAADGDFTTGRNGKETLKVACPNCDHEFVVVKP